MSKTMNRIKDITFSHNKASYDEEQMNANIELIRSQFKINLKHLEIKTPKTTVARSPLIQFPTKDSSKGYHPVRTSEPSFSIFSIVKKIDSTEPSQNGEIETPRDIRNGKNHQKLEGKMAEAYSKLEQWQRSFQQRKDQKDRLVKTHEQRSKLRRR